MAEGLSQELVAILGVGAVLIGVILTSNARISARLTAVEKETSRLSGLLEGLGLTGRLSRPDAGAD